MTVVSYTRTCTRARAKPPAFAAAAGSALPAFAAAAVAAVSAKRIVTRTLVNALRMTPTVRRGAKCLNALEVTRGETWVTWDCLSHKGHVTPAIISRTQGQRLWTHCL